MIKVTLACVGKLREKYLKDAQAEYLKRISRYARLEIVETAEEADHPNAPITEGKRLISASSPSSYRIAMCVEGEKLDSLSLARLLDRLKLDGHSSVCFIIGGSRGLSGEVKEMCDIRLSFSDFTIAHQLFRILLLEQLYRCFKISAGETYHK